MNMGLLPKAFMVQSREDRKANKRRALLHHLARKGGRIFGPVPDGTRREFFCLDEHTWVWHEEWTDEDGTPRAATTRYDVRPTGILKSQGANSYQRLTRVEEDNFRAAVKIYCDSSRLELQRLYEMA
jgi:hypothetical protein